jgi:hypothetical protein
MLGLITVALATHFNGPLDSEFGSLAGDDRAPSNRWRLTLKVGLHAVDGWEGELKRLTETYELISAETARRGGAIELVYRYQPASGTDARELITALNAIPTVESASAKPV